MRSLYQWENYLRPYFQSPIRLIGEIPMRRHDLEDLADSLREMIRDSENLGRATEQIVQNFPHVFLVFLTSFAAHNLERDFWGQIAQRLNIQHIHNHHWHRHYVDLIKQRGLRYFSGDETSRQYVATIRFHGGIPAYSLPDFFSSILLPSVQRPAFADLPADKALNLILQTVYNVDAPVINFLTNSSELGIEFFQTCREMAWLYLKGKEIPAPEATELPAYVIEAFANYMEVGEEHGLRLRKPALFFDPYDEPHLRLHLPEEQIPLRYVEDQLLWQITWDGQHSLIEYKPTIHKHRQDVLLRENYLPLDVSSAFLKVSLLRNGATGLEPIRRWNLACLPLGDRPLLVFRQIAHSSMYIWQMVSSTLALPASSLLLVFPSDVTAKADGDANCIDNTNPYLSGEWNGWKAQMWDLQNAFALHLLRDGNDICPPIPIEAAEQDAQLGGTVSIYNEDPDGIPLYANHTPILKVPIRSGYPLIEELHNWKINLNSSEGASLHLNIETDLSVYADQVKQVEDNLAELDLGILFDDDAFGTFKLRVRSAFDNETEFSFRILKSLYVFGLPKFIFPTANGAQPIEFSLRLPEGMFCESQPGFQGVTVESSIIATKITAQPESTHANLYLVKPLKQDEIVRIPIYIPLSRLSWSLLLETIEEDIQWTSNFIQKPIDAILQAPSAFLHLHLRGLQNITERISLLLIDPDNPNEIIQEERVRTNPMSAEWLRIPLSPFRTTLSHYEQASQLELHFQYRAFREEESVRLLFALFTRNLDIQNVNLQSMGELEWQLTWDETSHLRNRRVLISPMWQPWQKPKEFSIPDDARGSFLLVEDNEPVALPPSHYRIYFYISTKPQAQIPSNGFFEKTTSTLEDRLAELDRQTPHNSTHEFLINFERACILTESKKSINNPVNLCIEKVKNGQITNLTYLIKFHDWLSQQPNQQANTIAVRTWMFKPEIVRHALMDFRREVPERRSYVSYVTTNKHLHTESILLLVRYEDDPVVMNYCLKELVGRHKEPNGLPMEKIVLLLIEMIEKNRLSVRDTADLLAMQWHTALQALLSTPEISIRDTLVTQLRQVIEPSLDSNNTQTLTSQ